MRRPLSRKLVDLAERTLPRPDVDGRIEIRPEHGGLPRAVALLEGFLSAHGIWFERHVFDGHLRYYVHIRDLNTARAGIEALREMLKTGPRHA